MKPHLLPNVEEWTRLGSKPGAHCSLNRSNLTIVNRSWNLSDTDEMENTWRDKNGEPVLRVQATEDVPRK